MSTAETAPGIEDRFYSREEYRSWAEAQASGRFERIDGRIVRSAADFRVPSIMHYLIVHPTRRCVIHHRRNDTGIASAILHGGEIVMDPPGISITVEEMFAGT
jgi:hypothetical protein